MTKWFFMFFIAGVLCLNATEQDSPIEEKSTADSVQPADSVTSAKPVEPDTSTKAQNSPNLLEDAAKGDDELVFKPNQPTKSSYGAFRIGYIYQDLNSKNIPLQNGKNSYKLASSNAYFGLERGWVGGKNKMFLLGGYLDAGAGTTYYLSAGGVFGLRLLDGWLIPKLSIGYQLQHLSLPNDSDQYNIQSGVGTLGVFVNVMQGFGISLEGRMGIPFHIVRKDQANLYSNPSFNMYQLMVSFTFYDFGI